MGLDRTPKSDSVSGGKAHSFSGGLAAHGGSARAGFLPISIASVPLQGLKGIDLYLKTRNMSDNSDAYAHFGSNNVEFTEDHRERLIEQGVRYIYIPVGQHGRFRTQTEESLLEITADPNLATSIKAEIIYETSVELVNEFLSEPDLAAKGARLNKVCRAVTMLTLHDPTAFPHLFAASHHDFYTATHMVNVATWMVPLALSMGHTSEEELNHFCQAGLLHDVGKTFISAEILNRKGRLSDSDWDTIRQHPQLGYDHLCKFDNIHEIVRRVALEHHERMDGSGYPSKFKGEQIHIASRVCAVVDSFDAMTAFRPFKRRTLSVQQAVQTILNETPLRYDPEVVKAWVSLLETAEPSAGDVTTPQPAEDRTKRAFERFRINSLARIHRLRSGAGGWVELAGFSTVAHNLSRNGIGLLSREHFDCGDALRVYLKQATAARRYIDGTVVRCHQFEDGWFEIGVRIGVPAATISHAA